MADKQSLGVVGVDLDQGNVTTAGTVTRGTVKIQWDDDDTTSDISDAIERATMQFITYRTKRG